MEINLNPLIILSLCVILLAVILFKVKKLLKFHGPASLILSICASILAITALNSEP